MNNQIKQIFEMLGLKPAERFKIEGYGGIKYYFDRDMNLYKDESSDLPHYPSLALYFITGKCKIIKIPTFTKEDKIALNYVYYCLKRRYIAKNRSGEVYAHENEPHGIDGSWCNSEACARIDYDFSFISWEDDEPFNVEEWIKEQEENV